MHSPWQFWEPHPPRIKRKRISSGSRARGFLAATSDQERSTLRVIESRMIKPMWKPMHIQACVDSVLDC